MGRMAARRFEVEMRIILFLMQTEFNFTILQNRCSVQQYDFGTRYANCEFSWIMKEFSEDYEDI